MDLNPTLKPDHSEAVSGVDVTGEYKDMIEAFECDFTLALERKRSLSELDPKAMKRDIELLQKLSFELRYGKAKIVRLE